VIIDDYSIYQGISQMSYKAFVILKETHLVKILTKIFAI